MEQANEQHLQQLHGEAITYLASDSGSIQDEGTREKLLNNFLAQKELKLKLDAQVLLAVAVRVRTSSDAPPLLRLC